MSGLHFNLTSAKVSSKNFSIISGSLSGSTLTYDLDEAAYQGQVFGNDCAADRTVAFSNGKNGQVFDLRLKNTASAPTLAYGTKDSAVQEASGTLTITKPSSTANGDVLVLIIGENNDGTGITTPAGWTKKGSVTTPDGYTASLSLYHKVAGASEPSDYSITVTNGNYYEGVILRYTGVDNTTVFDQYAEATSDSVDSSITLPSITTTNDDTMVIRVALNAGSYAQTIGGGTTERHEGTNISASAPTFYVAEKTQASAGATGTLEATWSGTSDEGCGMTFGLKEAAGSAVNLTQPGTLLQGDLSWTSVAAGKTDIATIMKTADGFELKRLQQNIS